MKPKFFLLSLLIYSLSFSQEIDESLTLRPGEEKEYLFAADSVDDIDLTFERTDGGKLNISLQQYEGEEVFKEKKSKEFWTKFTSAKPDVYVLKVENPNKKESTFKIKVLKDSHNRVPVRVGYKTVNDTTYGEEVKRMKKIDVLETEILQNEKFYLNS